MSVIHKETAFRKQYIANDILQKLGFGSLSDIDEEKVLTRCEIVNKISTTIQFHEKEIYELFKRRMDLKTTTFAIVSHVLKHYGLYFIRRGRHRGESTKYCVLSKAQPQYTTNITTSPKRVSANRARKHMFKHGFVYLLQSVTGAYKIGFTANPKSRLRTFNVKLPFEVSYIALIETRDCAQLETDLHSMFANKRINGEWFNLSPDDVDYIKGLAE